MHVTNLQVFVWSWVLKSNVIISLLHKDSLKRKMLCIEIAKNPTTIKSDIKKDPKMIYLYIFIKEN